MPDEIDDSEDILQEGEPEDHEFSDADEEDDD